MGWGGGGGQCGSLSRRVGCTCVILTNGATPAKCKGRALRGGESDQVQTTQRLQRLCSKSFRGVLCFHKTPRHVWLLRPVSPQGEPATCILHDSCALSGHRVGEQPRSIRGREGNETWHMLQLMAADRISRAGAEGPPREQMHAQIRNFKGVHTGKEMV